MSRFRSELLRELDARGFIHQCTDAEALDAQAADGAWWLLLDLVAATATWRRAPYDPRPARTRARALGLDETVPEPALPAAR